MSEPKEVLTKEQIDGIVKDAARLLSYDDLGQGLIADMPLHVYALADTAETLRARLAAAEARAERLAAVVRVEIALGGVIETEEELRRLSAFSREAHAALQPGDLGEPSAT